MFIIFLKDDFPPFSNTLFPTGSSKTPRTSTRAWISGGRRRTTTDGYKKNNKKHHRDIRGKRKHKDGKSSFNFPLQLVFPVIKNSEQNALYYLSTLRFKVDDLSSFQAIPVADRTQKCIEAKQLLPRKPLPERYYKGAHIIFAYL